MLKWALVSSLFQYILTLKTCQEDHKIVQVCSVDELYVAPLPVSIDTEVYLNDIHGIDEVEKSISIYVELETYWTDLGISVSGNDSSVEAMVKSSDKAAIWHPTLLFENLLAYEKMGGYGGTGTYSFWHMGDSEMYYSEEAELKLYCNFDFSTFPFDSHICPVTWGDDEQGAEWIQLNSALVRYLDFVTETGTDPIIINSLPFPFEFQLESIPSFHKVYDTNYSYTGMTIKMKRTSLGLLLSGYYYPTGSFALLSLISFVIHVDVVPGRMGMIVTLYLITANVYNSVDAPPSRGFSYIEVWMFGAQCPILIALLEYGYVLYLKKYTTEKQQKRKVSPKVVVIYQRQYNIDDKIKKLDYATMICSLVLFTLFALAYWSLLLQ